ncbi:hypothetical protein [Pelagibius sp.]|uniref:hypothetical protein n=1 Tax=Pelagibius sp. TaxID=1931238 RepID=UPI003B5138E7
MSELYKHLELGRVYQDFQWDCVDAFERAQALRQALKDCLVLSGLHEKISDYAS